MRPHRHLRMPGNTNWLMRSDPNTLVSKLRDRNEIGAHQATNIALLSSMRSGARCARPRPKREEHSESRSGM
jgi:hypothetical protein